MNATLLEWIQCALGTMQSQTGRLGNCFFKFHMWSPITSHSPSLSQSLQNKINKMALNWSNNNKHQQKVTPANKLKQQFSESQQLFLIMSLVSVKFHNTMIYLSSIYWKLPHTKLSTWFPFLIAQSASSTNVPAQKSDMKIMTVCKTGRGCGKGHFKLKGSKRHQQRVRRHSCYHMTAVQVPHATLLCIAICTIKKIFLCVSDAFFKHTKIKSNYKDINLDTFLYPHNNLITMMWTEKCDPQKKKHPHLHSHTLCAFATNLTSFPRSQRINYKNKVRSSLWSFERWS